MFLEIILTLVLLLLFLIVRDRRPANMPPGPWEVPFLGRVPLLLGTDAQKLREKYGDIVTMRTGSLRCVLLFDFKTCKEVLGRAEFAGRPDVFRDITLDDQKTGGIIVSQGTQWTHERRFVLRSLRNLGMGKSRLEEAIMLEAKELVDDIRKYEGRPTTFPNSFITCSLNIVWQMVAGRRYDINSLEVDKLYKANKALQDTATPLFFLPMFFPWMRKLPKFVRNLLFKERLLDDFIKYRQQMVNETIEEHERRDVDALDHAEDLITAYLQGMKEGGPDNLFRKGSLMQVIADLFSAGSDTVSSSLKWVAFLLARYPDVAERLRQQIDDVVPRDETVSLLHKPKLPLLEAFITEMLRFSSLLELNLQHSALQDTSILGYFIPKDTSITVCNYSIHFDPQYWRHPHEFLPDRFLDPAGNFVAPREGIFAFGLGKRQCVGEALARMELFLFTAALVQNFDIRAPRGVTLTDETVNRMGVRCPLDKQLCYVPRG
ncbi:cytochrome P450 2L1 [Hyalella azteca]|uniref:Cytochrome P450 2L1 n=1 Tax=Hyalella azteca TaxID=294128 RepID=A0A8B7NGC8_HYAAZ|nr:cytochrome P450 2L1 [Hyalella azteca]